MLQVRTNMVAMKVGMEIILQIFVSLALSFFMVGIMVISCSGPT